MSYTEEWAAISARIKGLLAAGQVYAQFLQTKNTDTHGAGAELGRQCHEVAHAIGAFRDAHSTALPTAARAALTTFVSNTGKQILSSAAGASGQTDLTKAALIILAALETQVTHLLTDQQETIKLRTERAFLHLQRVLAADDREQKRWLEVFVEKGEVGCERLGAVHLLSHGIYAFKVNAEGARTDLILNEPLPDELADRGVEGLVLTEWKVADDATAAAAFSDAARQADLYSQGALLGLELVGRRYVIVVSEQQLQRAVIPADFFQGGILYRHINLAIAPRSPSAEARKSRPADRRAKAK